MSLPKEKQGIAASLVSTMVNYCISCGLGFAGTVHRHAFINASTARGQRGIPLPVAEITPLYTEIRAEAIKGPWFFAVGLSGLGVIIAAWFVLRTLWKNRREGRETG